MDHDRAIGEGVQVQEYSIVLAYLDSTSENNKHIYGKIQDKGLQVYLGCATLRPETMLGQTNVWV